MTSDAGSQQTREAPRLLLGQRLASEGFSAASFARSVPATLPPRPLSVTSIAGIERLAALTLSSYRPFANLRMDSRTCALEQVTKGSHTHSEN
jgi:hypothetical protein